MRTCLGCGLVDQQAALYRIVRGENGALSLDEPRCARGRGGYLHPHPQCWARFTQRKGPVRSFRAAVDRPARTALVVQLTSRVGTEG
jgi:predicted RNA-binding protein YlxR (DUF448 family)